MFVPMIGKFWKWLSPQTRTWITRRVQQKFTASVVAVITNDEGKVLLLDHVLRPRSGWGLPGGFIDRGEQPADAISRELLEETGIELTDVSIYRIRTVKRHIEMIFTAKAIGTPEIKSREITACRWCGSDELPEGLSRDQVLLIRQILQPDTGKKGC